MSHRTTFTLDEQTVTRIRRLAEHWQVSQAEVIRRVVAKGDAEEHPDPAAMLDALHRSGEGLAPDSAKAFLAEVREGRREWRGR
jgi:hypothetical protein